MQTRVHSGERPFVCQVEACNKAFKASGALSRHMRVYSDERRFGCQCMLPSSSAARVAAPCMLHTLGRH